MKAAEFHGAVRRILGPWCKSEGFVRGRFNSWNKQVGDKYIVFWFQVSRYGFDAYAGSSFIVEFQCSPSREPGGGDSNSRHRLPEFLSAEELAEVRDIQNTVIRLLQLPPANAPWFDNDYYQSLFQEIGQAYEPQHDVWLRYRTVADVELWARFVLRHLSSIVERLPDFCG